LPLFILPVLWVLTISFGALLLLFRQLRAMGVYVIVVPTCAGVASLVLSIAFMAILALAERLFRLPTSDLAPVISFLIGALLGGILGIALSVLASKKIVHRLGW